MATINYNGIKVPLPAGWEDGTQVVALGPVDNGFRPNMVASTEPAKPGETAEKFAARTLPSLRQALTGYKLVKEGMTTLGKRTGFLREHSFNAGGQVLSQLQFYVLQGGKAFTFTFTHLAGRFAQVRATGEKLFGSVELG